LDPVSVSHHVAPLIWPVDRQSTQILFLPSGAVKYRQRR